jgi:arylformamidase
MTTSDVVKNLTAGVGAANFVDLSPMIENGMPRWITHPHVVIHPTVTHEHDGYYTQTLNIAEHTGSHIDAPAHIHPNMMNATIETVPPHTFLAPATLFDLREFNLQPGEFATVEMFETLEARMDRPLTKGDVMLANFGWHERYWVTDKNWKYYGEFCPGFDEEAVEWIVARQPVAVGADTAAFDTALLNGKEVRVSTAHATHCLPKHIYIIECLANLAKLPSTFFFMALPLKIRNGSGSPVRAIAAF